mmetsp:Transcript_26704/g.67297  ORF Transcript_26704/g.67297 Transcript_26704/m.67297 type:complete len:244 (+) Transcript_26704:4570-5301(+)
MSWVVLASAFNLNRKIKEFDRSGRSSRPVASRTTLSLGPSSKSSPDSSMRTCTGKDEAAIGRSCEPAPEASEVWTVVSSAVEKSQHMVCPQLLVTDPACAVAVGGFFPTNTNAYRAGASTPAALVTLNSGLVAVVNCRRPTPGVTGGTNKLHTVPAGRSTNPAGSGRSVSNPQFGFSYTNPAGDTITSPPFWGSCVTVSMVNPRRFSLASTFDEYTTPADVSARTAGAGMIPAYGRVASVVPS